MRSALTDTTALLLFSTATGAFVELVVAGLTLAQTVDARIVAVPAILLTARPYGIFRDWVFRVGRARKGTALRRTACDILAFVTFQVPVYAGILAFAGATSDQIMRACASAVIILTIAGRPYGVFLDWFRRLAKTVKETG